MHTIKRFLIGATLAMSLSAHGGIISVSVPSAPLLGDGSYPTWDNVFTVSVPPYPFDTARGIGRITHNPGVEADALNRLMTLHVHAYTEAHVPTRDSIVTFVFDEPTVVAHLEVVQHGNGVTRIEGFAGTNLASMTSVGNVFGPRGDVQGTTVFSEGETNVFSFSNPLPGTIFQFRITKTSLADGYGLYRAYLRDSAGAQILPATCPPATIQVSEVEVSWPSRSNRFYNVEFRNQIPGSQWLPLATNVPGNGQTNRVYDRVPSGSAQRYYRIQCLPE